MLHETQHHRYIPGLDGIRGFAVLAVIAYHLNFSWAAGGFIGVDIFFVLSGYLITSIILPVYGNDIQIDFRDFWMRRIRRLLPAVFLMMITTVIWVVLWNRELMFMVRGDALSALLYISNWRFIFHNLSYFDSFGTPSPLKNLWSLSIEEQFYVVWPIMLLAGMYIFKKRTRFALAVILLALFSAILMSVLYTPGEDPSRVYYGTDTRSFELLIGCTLALVWPMKRLSSENLTDGLKYALRGTEFGAFILLLLAIYFIDEFDPFLYYGGMLLISLFAAVFIACVCHPSSLLGQLLSWKPIHWVGTRSYGIYLWHYPVIVLGTPVHEIGNPVYWHDLLKVALTLVLAELSYRFVEKPIRENGFKPFFQKVFLNNIVEWKTSSLINRMSIGLTFAAIIIFAGGMSGIADEKRKPHVMYTESVQEANKTPDQSADQSHEKKKKSDEETKNQVSNHSKKEVLAIGDSVMLDISPTLRKHFANITIDGKVGRQLSQALQLTSQYESFNQSDKYIVIELGTNGYFTKDQMDTLLNSFSKANIYLVNTRVPRQWESKVNELLRQQADSRPNVTLIDWHSEALHHPEYFASDGVHLVREGAEALTALIVKTIK
ncbi:acyltransferase family protein [Bacillus sp. CLL-7-23]|uniref:Acyltransferase family protein n=1 Tax=Bacillus changyiensis TaxID=3004103 RepID=A0ABT4X2T8_9BACI|nr:acyltransferase family protein [Bacillus changyiensis]MDA7026608.1 acyltransferase family protein [Bacillus changyiensis]